MFLVNSPVVRGDNLRFRKDGVREVLSSVLLPWLNSFRFFIGQVALLRKTTGVEFKYDNKAPVPQNVMDRWILARCQSLIKLVKEEMAAYRLHTIIPRLLGLIDELTNWYIRFNRKRLKGEDGTEDTVAALNTLFETLFTLCRTMVSCTKQDISYSTGPLGIVLVYAVLDRKYLPIVAGLYTTRGAHRGYSLGALLELPGSEGGVLRRHN
jgi:isoleucyl-tRNA synthetase